MIETFAPLVWLGVRAMPSTCLISSLVMLATTQRVRFGCATRNAPQAG